MIFKFGYDNGLIDKPIRYGQSFRKPSRKAIRQARNGNGKRMFEADELRTIIDAANQPLKSMILLGINTAFGQSDLSALPQSVLDLEQGWVDYPRPKTAVDRRCPLWLETIESVRDAVENRPQPKNKEDEGLVLVTKYGRRWVKLNRKGTPDDAVGKEFAKLLQSLGLKRPGLNFYALRHTFQTIGGESKDPDAVSGIMGHVDNSMAGVCRERSQTNGCRPLWNAFALGCGRTLQSRKCMEYNLMNERG
jgi:integrase